MIASSFEVWFGSFIKESDQEKLLGVTLDKTLNFKTHVTNLCKKASQKLHALALTKEVCFEVLNEPLINEPLIFTRCCLSFK